MKVQELLIKLKEMPIDMDVYYNNDNRGFPVENVEAVEIPVMVGTAHGIRKVCKIQ